MATNGIRTLGEIEQALGLAKARLLALEEVRCEQINQMHELNTEIMRLELQRRRLKSLEGVDHEIHMGNGSGGGVDGLRT